MQSVHYPAVPEGGSGWSWSVLVIGGEKRVSHSGGLPTQTSQLTLLPALGLGVVALTNAEDGDPQRLTQETLNLARIALDGACGAPEMSLDDMRPHLGRYAWAGSTGEEYWVVPVGGRLGIIPPLADDPAAQLICLSRRADGDFDITRGFGQGERGRFEVSQGATRFIGPSFSFDRFAPLPTTE
jgi:hypothetical protein